MCYSPVKRGIGFKFPDDFFNVVLSKFELENAKCSVKDRIMFCEQEWVYPCLTMNATSNPVPDSHVKYTNDYFCEMRCVKSSESDAGCLWLLYSIANCAMVRTIESLYIAVEYNTIFNTMLKEESETFVESRNSQKTAKTSSFRSSSEKCYREIWRVRSNRC